MLSVSLILLILSNAVNSKRDSSILYSRVSIIILSYTIYIAYVNIFIEYFELNVLVFSGLFKLNTLGLLFHIFVLLLSFLIVSISCFYIEKTNKKNLSISNKNEFNNYIIQNHNKIIEYPLIVLFCITGSMLLISSSDLISMFLSLELQSYALYLICSIYRNSENSVSAGLTYFLLGGLSSCIILFGQGFLYIYTGTTSIEGIMIVKNIAELGLGELNNITNNIQYSFIILSIGLLFKVSSAPFHFWSPDVYDAIPTIVTTFVSIIAKISIFIFLLELIYFSSTISGFSWVNNIMLSCLLSLIIGSVLGLTQYRIKRLYAYSTISHIGFLLLALSINNIESLQAFTFYLIQYSLSNLNAFFILIAIGYSLYFYVWNDKTISYRILKESNNSPVQLISQLKGYFYINWFLSISLIITLFSFVGVPPLIGFFAKQKILLSAIDNGYVFITLVAILTSVISAVYYLFIVKSIFFNNKVYSMNKTFYNIMIPQSMSIAISVITLIIVIFMLSNSIIDDLICILKTVLI